jgi:hypothetical protein
MTERMLVEFTVESTINREYGYQEKLIKFRETGTKYKAIVKDGELVAILGKKYNLIPNEEVEDRVKEIAKEKGLEVIVYKYGWKDFIALGESEKGVIVTNSVDGSYALKVVAYLSGLGVAVGSKFVENVYRKHSGSLKIKDLSEEISEIMKVADAYGEWLKKMSGVKATDCLDVIEIMATELPKKYTEKVITAVRGGAFIGEELTLKDVYETIARKIWAEDIDMGTKFRYYGVINDLVASIVSW